MHTILLYKYELCIKCMSENFKEAYKQLFTDLLNILKMDYNALCKNIIFNISYSKILEVQ